jgi:hypothetical protein
VRGCWRQLKLARDDPSAHISSRFRILPCSEMVDVQAVPLVLLVESTYSKRALFVASVECRAIRRGIRRAHATRDRATASTLKTIPLRVIPKVLPLRIMAQHRPPRVISQPTPLRIVGMGENCRQGGRRTKDLYVARCMTGRSRDEARLLTRRGRSARCGGDRRRGNHGCQQRYVVVHPCSHDHGPFDMLGMIPGPRGPGRCRLRPRVGRSAQADACRRVGGVGSSVVVGGLVDR